MRVRDGTCRGPTTVDDSVQGCGPRNRSADARHSTAPIRHGTISSVLSVFTDMLKQKTLYPSPDFRNGAALQDAVEPLFEAYFAGQKNDGVFAQMQSQSKAVLTKK